jgi:heat shock protein HslJ
MVVKKSIKSVTYIKSRTKTLDFHCSHISTICLLFTISMLAGCVSVLPPCNARTSPPAIELSGQWVLERWSLAPNSKGEIRPRPLPSGSGGQALTIQFDSRTNSVGGFAGCNRFTAQIEEDQRGITIERIVTTRMACSADRMEIESAFLYQLKDYQRLVRDDDRLLLIGRDQNVLRFVQSGKLN